ncbi:MAG: heme-binding protein [Actinomycetota bacterium]
MSHKRTLTIAAIGALALGTVGGLSLAMPSFAEQSTSARMAAPAVAPAAGTPASKLPTMSFLPVRLAQRAATAALADCTRQGFPVTATVVNADGITIVVLSNDGANAASVDASKGKAVASAGFRSPSDALGARAAADPGLLQVPGFVILGGGLPISSGGQVVGGIGVGGAPSGAIDKTCAQAGLDAIAGSL